MRPETRRRLAAFRDAPMTFWWFCLFGLGCGWLIGDLWPSWWNMTIVVPGVIVIVLLHRSQRKRRV